MARGGTDHEPGRHPDLAAPQAGKVAPEAVALRAQPRPVTRLNRRTLAILVGGLSVAVLGATIWSLQPQRRGAGEQTELYNVDRVSKSEGLDGLPADYSKLPPKVPELGPPLPGDLGPAIVKSQQPVTPPMRRRPRPGCAAQGGRSGGGFVGVLPLGQPARPPRRRGASRRGAGTPWRASTRWPPGRPRRRPSLPTRPPCRTGKTRKRRS
jgi:type IV secretory pathway VirB10-like protein